VIPSRLASSFRYTYLPFAISQARRLLYVILHLNVSRLKKSNDDTSMCPMQAYSVKSWTSVNIIMSVEQHNTVRSIGSPRMPIGLIQNAGNAIKTLVIHNSFTTVITGLRSIKLHLANCNLLISPFYPFKELYLANTRLQKSDQTSSLCEA